MEEEPINIPKLLFLIVGLGVVSYAFFYLGSQLRQGINVELGKAPIKFNGQTRKR